MLKAFTPLAALLVALALAGPAAAQGPSSDVSPVAPVCSGVGEDGPATCTSGDQAVGDGQVITDPADQVDGPTAPDDGDRPADTPKRGEQHVLGATTVSSTPAPAATTAPVASHAPAPAAAASSAKTLPFTGVNAGYLALCGSLLLGSGLLLRRRVASF